MSERLLLRIAAFAVGFVALGHTVGGMILAGSHGAREDELLRALADYRFDTMGVVRSHAEFYEGEGWFLSLALAMLTAHLVQLASIVDEHRKLVLRLVVPPLAFCVLGVGLTVKFFFTAPLVGMAVAAVALAITFLRLNR